VNFIEYICTDKFMKEKDKTQRALNLWNNLWTNNNQYDFS